MLAFRHRHLDDDFGFGHDDGPIVTALSIALYCLWYWPLDQLKKLRAA